MRWMPRWCGTAAREWAGRSRASSSRCGSRMRGRGWLRRRTCSSPSTPPSRTAPASAWRSAGRSPRPTAAPSPSRTATRRPAVSRSSAYRCKTTPRGQPLDQNEQHHAAVLRPAFAFLVAGDRGGLAVGDDVHAVQRQAFLLVQVAAHRLGAGLAELLVVLVGADVVGVPLHLDVDRLAVGLDLGGELVEGRLGAARELGLVEAELHLVVGEHGLVEQLALGQLARFLRALQGLLGGLRSLAGLLRK